VKMELILSLALLLVLSSLGVLAQPEEVWNRTYGGPGIELGHQVQVTSDDGYVLVGHTESYGAGRIDVWLIKTDSEGSEEWNKTFGGVGDDRGLSVQQTKDDGYIITGYTKSYGVGNSDVWLIKTDSSGMKQWDRTFGGPGLEAGRSVMETKDGGYIITGGTESYGTGGFDIWLIKTDSEGNEKWNKTFGGPGYDWAFSVQQTKDGEYIITGRTHSYDDTGEGDFWLIKTDPEGNKEWERSFGGPGYDASRSVQETNDGGYVIVGNTESYGAGSQDIWVVKTDASGNEQWNRTFGGAYYEAGSSVLVTEDGGYIITGYTESYGYFLYRLGPTGARPGNAWLIKTDSKGNKVWDMIFGYGAFEFVQETIDRGYIILGTTTTYTGSVDIWLIKLKEM